MGTRKLRNLSQSLGNPSEEPKEPKQRKSGPKEGLSDLSEQPEKPKSGHKGPNPEREEPK